MAGGTANCSVILSDDPIGSPIVDHPDVLIAMNLPSLDKYADAVVPGGKIFHRLHADRAEGESARRARVLHPGHASRLGQRMAALAKHDRQGKVLRECPELGEARFRPR